MAMNYISSVPKLIGRENYDTWCFAVENLLVLEGLQKAIEGTETDSVQVAKAKAKLVLTIDPSLYVHVKEAKTAVEIWTRLQSMYADTGFSRKIGLLRTLISLRLDGCTSMEDYVNSVIDISQKLRRTGFEIDDNWIGSLLLAGLPDKYEPMIMAIEHSGIKISSDAIKTKLLDMCTTEGSSSNASGAFAARNRFLRYGRGGSSGQKSQRQDGNKKNEVRCFKCKELGHYMNKCPKNSTNGDKDMISNAFSAVFLSGNFKANEWYVDSGASVHLTARKDWLENIDYGGFPKEIVIANGTTIQALCSGNLTVSTKVNNRIESINIYNVFYVPEITTNLLSVSQILKKGNKIKFEKEVCNIFNAGGSLIAEAVLSDNVYKLKLNFPDVMMANLTVTSQILHRRFAHLNYSDLKVMQQAVEGLDVVKGLNTSDICEVCAEGKQTRLPFKNKGHRATSVLEVVHADLCGPLDVPSIGGSRYFMVLEDDVTRMTFVYFLRSKDQALQFFKDFKAMVENQTNQRIKILRSDNGGEFCSRQVERFLSDNGIIHQKTTPYTPEQNGMLERMNRTVGEKASCLLFDSGLSKCFWAEAVHTAVYLRNRCVAKGLGNKTPYEMWHNKRPNVKHIKIFGSEAMVHVPKQKRTKLDKKSQKMLLIGFCDNVKGYRLWDSIKKKVVISRDVIIIEKEKQKIPISVSESVTDVPPPGEIQDRVGDPDPVVDEIFNLTSESECTGEVYDSDFEPSEGDMSQVTIPEGQSTVRRSERERRAKTYEEYVTYSCTENTDIEDVPLTVAEALSRPDADRWREAMADEMQSFAENDAWDLVDSPNPCSGMSVVQCKWVFKKKCDSENGLSFRARLVAKGFTQKAGIDYDETFAPVIRFSSLRLLLALSVKLDLNITHFDVKTAFLNGHLNEKVFMRQPEGFVAKGLENKVCLLKRAIYGLKQSSRVWNKRVDDVLTSLNFKKSIYEPCLYTQKEGELLTIVALYVDDFLIFSNDCKTADILENELSRHFKIKNLKEVKQFLGMRIRRSKDCVIIDQESYINQILKRFNMTDCKSVNTPIESFDFSQDANKNESENPYYQQLIGSLMYVSVLTRPDISFSISFLSQFNKCNTEYHWKCVKRILRYLQGTKSYCLKFSKDSSDLVGFVDSDWGSDKRDRRSYTGYVFKLSGSAISWRSTKQKTVALSSTEAEYMALCEASKEAMYLKNLLSELVDISKPLLLYNDNQSAQKLCSNPMFHDRSKHIDIKYHFVRNAVLDNVIEVKYLSTDNMIADILTKVLGATKFCKFVSGLGLRNI